MPLYEYECETCGIRFERKQRMADAPLRTCPECSGPVHRVIQPVGIVFKGSGFYCTDHRTSSGATLSAGKSESADKSASADKSEPAAKGTKKETAASD